MKKPMSDNRNMADFSSLLGEISSEENYCVGIIGGGGKTSLQNRLGRELSAIFNKVLLTSLTKSGNSRGLEVKFLNEIKEDELNELFEFDKINYIMKARQSAEKLIGISEKQLSKLKQLADVTIFECDGARKRPFKAHRPHDPMIPYFATHAIIVIGAEVINKRISDGFIHRPEIFMEKWDVNESKVIDSEFIAQIVASEDGYMEKVPGNVQPIFFVNKAELNIDGAKELGRLISEKRGSSVYYGSLKDNWVREVE